MTAAATAPPDRGAIMAADAVPRRAARRGPDLAAEHLAPEDEIGHAFRIDGARLADILTA